ncbi:hypothetical protein [Pseudomonas phage Rollin]|nr:hypothetical protein [Pseudomonas phage Rollin]
MKSIDRTDFSGGIDNVSPVDSLPDKAVRDLCNFDPNPTGKLSLRPSLIQQEAITDVVGAVQVDDDLIVVAGTLRRFYPSRGFSVSIGAAPAGSSVVGAGLNGDAFMQVGVTQLRVRGETVAPWALPEIVPQVSVAAGALPAGVYKVAVTALDTFNAESGATPLVVHLTQPGAISLAWTAPAGAVETRVYCSAPDGETLYLQGAPASAMVIANLRDDTTVMTTGFLQPPPLASQIATYKGRLMLAAGSTLWGTEPFAPHLVNYVSGFISYDADIQIVQPVNGGVYVATDLRTYFVEDFGLDTVRQAVVAEVGATAGSQVLLPDGRASWLTPYGQVFGDPGGKLDFPQRQRYAPPIASAASAGVFDHNGVQVVVNSLRGAVNPNTLAVTDSFDMEID